ncbi:phospholipase D family protein [Luteimonas sp. M1R5S18]|uniref:Phospholipase D family protein n=1 Tax=Luteimonas rhizosphaericola TaxID=3042024 RepID=A0ABT6JGU2_9GAMM|nr:phospholipase D family protein [Luteimonas rhizosphaericola]MDH5829276.1 phospholipase D family protein [Luteimonas rhizosphaericola]
MSRRTSPHPTSSPPPGRTPPTVRERLPRILAWGVFSLAMLVLSGILLADHLMPPATGAPSHALEIVPGQTALDRELAPLLARNPGKTGTIMLPDGLDAFAARAISARQAGRSLDLQYYIWHDDLTGHLLMYEAWKAAERGVRVRLLLDDISISGMDAALLALDSHANIEIRVYNPFRNRDGIARVLEMVQRMFSVTYRMHNKAWIADGQAAVVGGRNVGLEYFGAHEETNFLDLDVLLFGPAVREASAIFDEFWNSEAVVPIAQLNRKPKRTLETELEAIKEEARGELAQRYLRQVDMAPSVRAYFAQELTPFWTDRIRVLSDPPVKWKSSTRTEGLVSHLMDTLRKTERKALLISPYFVPGNEGVTGFASLVRTRGAHVGVITNSLAANDVLAVHGGYANYRKALLKTGVALYEMRPQALDGGSSLFGSSGASLHTKAFVVDDRYGFIGSFNIDPRSIMLNTEMGVLFDEPALAIALREEYQRLSGPDHSYWVYLDSEDRLRWLDRAADPPVVLEHEPETSWWQRALARVIGWLPVESQL